MPDIPLSVNAPALISALSDPDRESEYARAVADVLILLGLLDDSLAPTHEIAGMLIDSLRAHLQDGVAVDLSSLNLLKRIELARNETISDPTPARTVTVVQAIFKRQFEGEDRYLMQYDADAGRYQPIGGKIDANDVDPEYALRREIMEELHLSDIPGDDVLALTQVGEIWSTVELSATYGILTRYAFHFFHVESAGFPMTPDEATPWVSRSELLAGQAADGRSISPILIEGLGWRLLNQIPPLRG